MKPEKPKKAKTPAKRARTSVKEKLAALFKRKPKAAAPEPPPKKAAPPKKAVAPVPPKYTSTFVPEKKPVPTTVTVVSPDPALIELGGTPVLISHGDSLCTRDIRYQYYRKFLESSFVRWLFPRLSYAVRMALVNILQPAIKQSARTKPPEIMDVDADAVVHTMRSHGVRELIHGHTHRPGIHALTVDNQPARRIVLGDWYERELILVCRGPARELLSVSAYLDRCRD